MKLAFGCNARCGKDTAALYLANKCDGYDIFSFSQPLYEIMSYTQKLCGLTEEKDRDFLRAVGMWGRNKDENIWVNVLVDKVKRSDKENIFVTDVRFPNEYKALKELGFTLVKIERKPEDENLRNHISETSMEGYDWDYVIDNNGTLWEFYEKLDKMFIMKENL